MTDGLTDGMTDGTRHIAFDTLNDYVDGLLAPPARRDVERHVVTCAECAAELAELRRVLAAVAAAPRAILPPDDLWRELRADVERRKELTLPSAARAASNGRGSAALWANRAWLAVAAVVLVVVSSAVTATVLNRGRAPVLAPGDAPGGAQTGVLLTGFRVAEDEYLRTIGELRSALDAQRGRLAPETVATVERSLVIIDAAIDEARAALLGDPGNQTLVDLLAASYERKLDLLRRASELPARS